MTKILPPQDTKAQIRDLQNRLHKLETEAPQALAIKDGNGQVRVVVGKLDVLGGGYVGKYGWVVLDSGGTLVASQYA